MVDEMIALIAMYSHVFSYHQEGFGQEDFSGTGTNSKAARACQWGENTNRFILRIKAELPAFSLLLAPACPS